MHDDPVQFRVSSVTSLEPEVIARTGYSRSMTTIEATGSNTNPSASMVDTSWKLVGEDVPVGVSYTGDPAFMLRIAVIWQQQPTLDAINLIEVPFVAAHVAHAILRYIPAAEVTALAEKASKRKPGDPGHSLLVGWLTEHIQHVIREAGDPPATPEQADVDARGVVPLDRALAAVVTKVGKTGAAIAKKILTSQPAAPWARWRREDGGAASTISALRSLASVGWLDVVKPKMDREGRSKPLHVRANLSADHKVHARIPKMASPMSWAFGAPGKEIAMDGKLVEEGHLDRGADVDGQTFASVPFVGQKALVPRGWSLLPHDRDKYPHQTCLPMDSDGHDVLPIVVSQNQGVVMSTIAGKLALLILASPDVQGGGMSYVTLSELARLVYPGASRVQQREVTATMAAVNELSKLFLYLPDGRKLRIFDVTQSWAPDRAGPSLPIHYGLTRTFMGALQEVRMRKFAQPVLQGQEYTGDFLMNLSGMLALPNNRPALLRYYTRACALWNAACVTGDFDPARAPAMTPDEWALRANALSHGVVEYLDAKAAGNRQVIKPWHKAEAHKNRKDALGDLDELKDRGLVVLDKSGRSDAIRILPPDNWKEARALGVSSGTRLHRLAADIEVDSD